MHGKARTMPDAFYALFAMNCSPENAVLFVSRDDRSQNYHFYFLGVNGLGAEGEPNAALRTYSHQRYKF